jgi:AcrR family transcriptional regulator
LSKLEELREAALRLFSQKGFQATGIRDLADAIGVTTAALYHYMDTKEDLLLEIMTRSLTCSLRAMQSACAIANSPEGRLVAFVRTHVIVEGKFPEEAIVVDGELRALSAAARAKVIALRDSYEGLLDEILLAGCEQGTFTLANRRLTRLAILESGNGLSRWYSPTGHCTLTEIADVFADLALAAVRAHRGEALTLSDVDLPSSDYFLEVVVKSYQLPLEAARAPRASG